MKKETIFCNRSFLLSQIYLNFATFVRKRELLFSEIDCSDGSLSLQIRFIEEKKNVN